MNQLSLLLASLALFTQELTEKVKSLKPGKLSTKLISSIEGSIGSGSKPKDVKPKEPAPVGKLQGTFNPFAKQSPSLAEKVEEEGEAINTKEPEVVQPTGGAGAPPPPPPPPPAPPLLGAPISNWRANQPKPSETLKAITAATPKPKPQKPAGGFDASAITGAKLKSKVIAPKNYSADMPIKDFSAIIIQQLMIFDPTQEQQRVDMQKLFRVLKAAVESKPLGKDYDDLLNLYNNNAQKFNGRYKNLIDPEKLNRRIL